MQSKLVALALIITIFTVGCSLFKNPGIEIKYRSFSGALTIGPPAEQFAAELENLTASTLGGNNKITFKKITPRPPIPDGNIVAAVGRGARDNGFDAAYVSGGALNPTWGFIYNSGIPVTNVDFNRFVGFLYGNGGLELLQKTLDRRERNIIALPIVGGPAQGSGYFPAPVGDTDNRSGIGLKGLCQENWTFRYLPPAQDVLDTACDRLVGSKKKINFVKAVPGVQLLEQVSEGKIQAFEFVTPADDYEAFFSGDTNPGTLGLPYLHSPAWHQPFLITYLIVNKQVWKQLSRAQQESIETTARANLTASYSQNLAIQGEGLQKILKVNQDDGNPNNDIELVGWPDRDLKILAEATREFLDDRSLDNTFSMADRLDYEKILTAYKRYIKINSPYWNQFSQKEVN